MNWLVLCSKFKKGTVRASWEALPHPAQKGGPTASQLGLRHPQGFNLGAPAHSPPVPLSWAWKRKPAAAMAAGICSWSQDTPVCRTRPASKG